MNLDFPLLVEVNVFSMLRGITLLETYFPILLSGALQFIKRGVEHRQSNQ